MRLSRDQHNMDEDGFILIAVLWILAALAGLIGMYAVYASTTARSTLVYGERLRSEEAIYAGLEMTAFRLGGARDAKPDARGAFVFPLGDSFVSVAYVPETERIDLNAASKETLTRLFVSAGAKETDASYMAERVIGWRTGGEDGLVSPEGALYASSGLPYGPREGAFQSVEELWSVLGLPVSVVEAVLPKVTVYGGRAQFEAPPQSAPTAGPPSVRVAIDVARAGVTVRSADVVIVLPLNGRTPYDVLSWRED